MAIIPKTSILVAHFVCLLALTHSSFAQVFKCVDPATGQTTFTDTACPDKGTGDYISVAPANSDSGYASGVEIEANRRARDTEAEAHRSNVDRWVELAEEQEQEDRIAKLREKADRLTGSAGSNSSLRQAEAAQRAALATEQGNDPASQHYEKAEQYFNKAGSSRDITESNRYTRQGMVEVEAGRAAQGLPPSTGSILNEPGSMSAPAPIPTPFPQPSVITNCDQTGCWDNVGNRYNRGAGETYIRQDGKVCQGSGPNMQCN